MPRKKYEEEEIQASLLIAGRECKLGKVAKGEAVPANCYFWQPIVEGGAG